MDVKKDGQSLVGLIAQLNKALHKRSSEELLGLRLKSYMALGYVRDHDRVSQQELESAMYMDANAVVLLLNEMEAAHYVIRRRDPQDRRRHIVELTEAGRRALEKADKARESLEDEMLAGLSVEQRKTLRSLVERVLETLSQPVAETRV